MRKPTTSDPKDFPETEQEYPGGQYFFIETDFKLMNLLPRHVSNYNKTPFVYYKYIKTSTSEFFERKDTKLFLYSTRSTYDQIGTENAESQFCGEETIGPVPYLNTEVRVVEIRKWDFDTRRSVTQYAYKQGTIEKLEKPKLGQAGEVDMAYRTRSRGDSLEGFLYSRFDAGVGIMLDATKVNYDYNVSSDQLIEQWNNYVNTRNAYGVNSEQAKTSQIRFKDKFGQPGLIDNFDDFQRLFPKYFLVAGENLSSSLSRIVGKEKFVRIDHTNNVYPESYVGLWQKFAAEGLSEKAVVERLLSTGYTQAQINATRSASSLAKFDARHFAYNAFSESALVLAPLNGSNNPNNPTPGGGSTNSNGGINGGARNPNGSAWSGPEGYEPGVVQSITVPRSRNSFVTSETTLNSIQQQLDSSRQVMYQVYMKSFGEDGTPKPSITAYAFDFSPNDINYSGFAGEWQSIERSGSFPIIDWKSFKLLQISFSFLIANKTPGQLTADGLETPVTKQIEKLQRMAQQPYPVIFYGFDDLLTNQFRYDSSGKPRGIQFVIQDLSITSQRRNERMEITRAQASITLQEIPIETTNIIGMPRLTHKNPPPPKPPVPTTDPDYALFEKNLFIQAPDKYTFTD